MKYRKGFGLFDSRFFAFFMYFLFSCFPVKNVMPMIRKLTREDYADPSPTRVARFFLGKLDGIERRALAPLQKQEVAAVVDNADGDMDVAPRLFGFRTGHHGLDGG